MKKQRSIADRLKEFGDKLRSGVPIEATRVTVEKTPDGPLTTRKHVVIQPKTNAE